MCKCPENCGRVGILKLTLNNETNFKICYITVIEILELALLNIAS